MSITLSSASLPIFTTALNNLSHCLDKAARNAAARQFDGNVLLGCRLAPDMLPLAAQVRIACDVAKYGAARLAGLDAPRHEDNETTLDELQARIRSTLEFLASVPTSRIDGREEAEITFPVGRERTPRTMTGEAYLKHWALPNLYFHVTTAYALLRHNGVDLGKTDFLLGAHAAG